MTLTRPVSADRDTRSPASTSTCHNASPGPSIIRRHYEQDASIALVGMRGAGLSTLGVMAASALGFRLVDSDQNFYLKTGLSRADYRATHGTARYRSEETGLLRSMLSDNPRKSVIVCGPGAVEATGKDLLAQFAQTKPVIYVTRDVAGMQRHLRVPSEEKMSALLRQCAPVFRSISTFEFHNLSDFGAQGREIGWNTDGQQSPKSLALKQVERDFVHLLHFIIGKQGPEPALGLSHDGLASDSGRATPYTYALSLPADVPDTLLFEMSQVDVSADAVELKTQWTPDLLAETPGGHASAMDRITRQFYAIRRSVQLPIIFKICPEDDSNHSSPMSRSLAESYFGVSHHALRLGVEFISVDLAFDEDLIRGLVAAKGTSKIIAHHKESAGSPLGWDDAAWKDTVRRAKALGADLVRLCRPARSTADNIAVRNFVDQMNASPEIKIPVIAYNTGYLGRMSCYLNPILSPVTSDLVRAHSPESPRGHLLTAQEAQRALYGSLMLEPKYFGIYGSAINSSLSPDMHNAAFRYSGMPHDYRLFQHDTLAELRRLIRDPHFGGASITAPFKSQVISLVDWMSPEAEAIGAVNTLIPVRSPNGDSVYGENTDWIGVRTCVERNLSPINAVKRRTTALVLGAGGMARATTYALIRMGVRTIVVHNRTESRAEDLVAHFESQSFPSQHMTSESASSREGSADFPRDASRIRVLRRRSDPWPQDIDHPTIIVSCISTRDQNGRAVPDTTIPAGWLESPTGGVAIEVSGAS